MDHGHQPFSLEQHPHQSQKLKSILKRSNHWQQQQKRQSEETNHPKRMKDIKLKPAKPFTFRFGRRICQIMEGEARSLHPKYAQLIQQAHSSKLDSLDYHRSIYQLEAEKLNFYKRTQQSDKRQKDNKDSDHFNKQDTNLTK